MKLEVGKYYLTSGGVKRGPVEDRGDYLAASGWHYRSNGTHLYGESLQDLIEECKDEVKITMDGKYAYRKDPYTQVRILCVDRPGSWDNVVISMDAYGTPRVHTATGACNNGTNPDWDLVPLQEKLLDLWVVVYEDGGIYSFRDKSAAEAWIENSLFKPKLYKYIPAPDQTS